MPEGKGFRFGYALIVIFLVIFLAMKVNFIFTPVLLIVQILAIPIILSGVLYYLLRPLVRVLSTRIPKSLAILLIYLFVTGVIVTIVFLIGPIVQLQSTSFANAFPGMVGDIRHWLLSLQNSDLIARFQANGNYPLDNLSNQIKNNLQSFLTTVGSSVTGFIGAITNFLIGLFLIPFVLFYMLKDGEKLPDQVVYLLPQKHQAEGRQILSDMDKALSSYIQGQLIVSVCVGFLVYIGYVIIGLKYSLVLGLFAMFTTVIPFIGPIIGTIPGLIVAILDSPFMVVKVLIVVVAAQQIEGNLISPYVMGKKLDIHPLTIIFLLLVAGSLAGLAGLLLAVPAYAIAKVIVQHIYRLIQLKR